MERIHGRVNVWVGFGKRRGLHSSEGDEVWQGLGVGGEVVQVWHA